jgi:hypothetical protein
VVLRVVEVRPGYVIGIVVNGPAALGFSRVRAGDVGIRVQCRAVVAAAAEVDPEMLDLAPVSLEELVGQIRSRGASM